MIRHIMAARWDDWWAVNWKRFRTKLFWLDRGVAPAFGLTDCGNVRKTSPRISDVPGKIRIYHLRNTRVQTYRYTRLFGRHYRRTGSLENRGSQVRTAIYALGLHAMLLEWLYRDELGGRGSGAPSMRTQRNACNISFTEGNTLPGEVARRMEDTFDAP
jgi:hypothetical protein